MAIPIPRIPSGFTIGDPVANVRIDAFVDIQCPHSKLAWPTLNALAERYSKKPLSITAHLITLSNHRQAWDMSLGLFAVAGNDAQHFWDFATYLYERQETFSNEAFRDKTHNELRQLVAEYAHDFSGLDKQAVLEQLDSNEIYVAARTPIRYSATRAVWGTPTFFINNADDVPVNHRSTVDEWAATIDELM